MAFDIPHMRRQFPFFAANDSLIYLDSAATAQKPETVLAVMDDFYRKGNANVHRGMYELAERATALYEGAREAVRTFIRARHSDEIIFTKSTTESLNLVAKSWGKAHLRKGDVVVLSILEHHSVIVPWLQLKEETGITIEWIDCDDEGRLIMNDLKKVLAGKNVKLVAVSGQSNVLGVRPLVSEIIKLAHQSGALVCIDATQLIAHHPVDVTELDCDFLAFSGHKLYGPTGIGVLYAKREILKTMPPFLGGGSMIEEVRRDGFTPADPPHRFEAGTPPIAEAAGLTAAIDWLVQFPWKEIEEHEKKLMRAAFETLNGIEGLHILGPKNPDEASACVSFVLKDTHPHDLADILGQEGFCLRAGHHCAEPLHKRFSVPASLRLSVGIYNTEEEIHRLGPALKRAISLLKK